MGHTLPGLCKDRRKGGFSRDRALFSRVGKVEASHEARYKKLYQNIVKGTVFKSATSAKWHCRNCGYVHEGKTAPAKCPACDHPQAHFELLAENY